MDHGLPDWNTLLQKLILSTIQTPTDDNSQQAEVIAKAFTRVFSPNALIAARYLSLTFKQRDPSDPLAFTKAIRKAIYEDIDMTKKTDLLTELRNLCVAVGKSPNIDSVITYNYDDLLEHYIDELDLGVPLSSVYRTGMNPMNHELPIYHVHGFLPRDGEIDRSHLVTLSEDIYHHQYNDIYSWSNLVQINKFKDANCLFTGVSFTDPNLRRLMDIARAQRGDEAINHYCFRKRHDAQRIKLTMEAVLQQDPSLRDQKVMAQLGMDETVNDLIKIMENFEANDAASFGVALLWIDDYNEIPGILRDIRTGGAASE